MYNLCISLKMTTLTDLAYVLKNCDQSTLIVLSGPGASGKSFVSAAIRKLFGHRPQDVEFWGDSENTGVFNPSAAFAGRCRILETLHKTVIVDSSFPWVRNICFITVNRSVLGTFRSPTHLALELTALIKRDDDDDEDDDTSSCTEDYQDTISTT